ncbi:MAG: hypothetical protein FWE80_05565, partial [Oscillospiraceae bacterium]|nr:hypothetical protein [Oscillospiraceae bacterium]
KSIDESKKLPRLTVICKPGQFLREYVPAVNVLKRRTKIHTVSQNGMDFLCMGESTNRHISKHPRAFLLCFNTIEQTNQAL